MQTLATQTFAGSNAGTGSKAGSGQRPLAAPGAWRSSIDAASMRREQEWGRLMLASLAGNQTAYRILLDALAIFIRAEVRRGLARYGQSTTDVDDVTQETLLALHLKRETWRTDQPLGPWVRAISRNKVIDSLRRKGRHLKVPLDDVADSLAAPAQGEHLTIDEADRILQMLTGRQREVVAAISLNGLSIREAAAKLSITEGAVRVALHRGLATLAKAYRAEDV
jgi:RNA polymerase sigma-70 factor, ECF subfamily